MIQVKIVKDSTILDLDIVEKIIEFDKKNMETILKEANMEFPEEKRRKTLANKIVLIMAMKKENLIGYIEYCRNLENSREISISSLQIEEKFRGTSLLMLLIQLLREELLKEDFDRI